MKIIKHLPITEIVVTALDTIYIHRDSITLDEFLNDTVYNIYFGSGYRPSSNHMGNIPSKDEYTQRPMLPNLSEQSYKAKNAMVLLTIESDIYPNKLVHIKYMSYPQTRSKTLPSGTSISYVGWAVGNIVLK